MTLFLSASIPLPDRDFRFFETADIVAIRDATKALIREFAPHYTVHFGGHPAITPLISLMMERHTEVLRTNIILYYSDYFRDVIPEETTAFTKIIFVDQVHSDRDESLLAMRKKMLTDTPITAAFFIGGMEGVLEEFELVKMIDKNTPCFPIASTGGAALEIFNSGEYNHDLLTQLTYRTLFRKIRKLIS